MIGKTVAKNLKDELDGLRKFSPTPSRQMLGMGYNDARALLRYIAALEQRYEDLKGMIK